MKKRFFLMIAIVFLSFQMSGDEDVKKFDLYTLDDVLYSSQKELEKNDTKIMVADFFSIHCEPCKKSISKWDEVYRKYSAKGLKFVVIVIPVEEDRSAELVKIKEFFKKQKISFPVVFDKYSITGKKFGIVDNNGSAVVPQMFMLDKTGRIIFKSEKHPELIKEIEKSL